MLRRHITGISLIALLATLAPGCGDSGGSGDDGDDGTTAPDAAPPVIDATLGDAPPALCEVQVTPVAAEAGVHFRPGEPITWSTNPPATGAHYSVWARWGRNYDTAIPRGYWVHNLE